MILSDEVGSNEGQICELFRKKFPNIFTDETLTPQQVALAAGNEPRSDETMNHTHIDDKMIRVAFRKLKSSITPGPDGIPSTLLKKCADELLFPLSLLFRLSLASGIFPLLWKTAIMFPVHKKGDKRNVENYRGISSLCAVSKLFELVVMEPIFSYCKEYISNQQHGFMPKRSTTTNLVEFTSYVTDGLEDGVQVDAIYTDLSAAFDKINHEIAAAKLERLGFGSTMMQWLWTYLNSRTIRVNVGDKVSAAFEATSSIPQGSHIGPLIFLIYFNDINLSLEGPRLSFADDLKIYLRICSQEDARLLQSQLDTAAEWCFNNRMVINPGKCSVITFSRKKEPIHFEYHLHGSVLSRESCVKDLGVILDSELSFRPHVSYVVEKASRQLGFIFRTTKEFSDIYCLKSLFCSLVRSILEYCASIWSPYYQNGVERIEAVQRRFIRFALRRLPWNDPFRLPSYENRCQLIHLDTLQVRRDLLRAMLVSDVITGRTDCPTLFENISFPPRVLRNNNALRVPFHRTNYAAFGAITGLLRCFNRVSLVFDARRSRETIKDRFLTVIRKFR